MEEDVLPWSEVPRLLKIYEESGIEYYGMMENIDEAVVLWQRILELKLNGTEENIWECKLYRLRRVLCLKGFGALLLKLVSPQMIPKSLLSETYLILENFYRWHVSHSDKEIKILVPNGKIDDYGTYAVLFPQNHNIVFDTKNTDLTELKAFLTKCFQTHCIHGNFLVIGPTKERLWSVLEEAIRGSGVKTSKRGEFSAYYLAKEQAILLPSKCPEEVYVSPLKTEHAELINSVWPHRYEGSIHMIRTVVERNGGIGIFLKENDDLVSWALISPYNGPGALQTVDSQKRKGYAELSVVTISKVIAEKGHHPFLYILNVLFKILLRHVRMIIAENRVDATGLRWDLQVAEWVPPASGVVGDLLLW